MNRRARSESDLNLDDESPSTVDLPPLEPLPRSDQPFNSPGWSDATNPLLPRHREPRRISTSSISLYLEVYQERGYGIWPVVDVDVLLARLLTHSDDMEAYALATAICAATISQFQMDTQTGSPVEGHLRMSSAVFEAESKRARNEFDHMEQITLGSLLSTFFLHVYSADIGRMSASTILLGEAITKAHMTGLHKPSYYQALDTEQQQHSLRVYWLLFITER